MSNIVLTEEQKMVVDLIQKYKCLRLSQVEDILDYYFLSMNTSISKEDLNSESIKKVRDNYIKRTLGILFRRGYLVRDSSDYVKANNNIRPLDHDNKMMAFWVYLSFLGKVDLRANYPANYPSEIFFIKDNQQYEALYVKSGQEYVVNMLLSETKKEKYEQIDKMVDGDISNVITKYVVGVDNLQSIEKVKKYPNVENSDLKNVLFVVMDFEDPTQKPQRKFVAF